MHTWWVPLSNGKPTELATCPWCPVLRAIQCLFSLSGLSDSEYSKYVMGAEWWIQHKPVDCDIPFHFDKDEALSSSSADGRMVCPLRSTVTYLKTPNPSDQRACGAPTMILNTCTTDGSDMQPTTVPSEVLLSYPRRNKHVVFRGDHLHGVPANLRNQSCTSIRAEDCSNSHAIPMRLTFLVNWWHLRPGEPNCREFTSDCAAIASKECHTESNLCVSVEEPSALSQLVQPISVQSSHPNSRVDEQQCTVLLPNGDGGEELWNFTVPSPPLPHKSWTDVPGSTLRIGISQ